MTDPRELSPREAWQRYVDRRRTEASEKSVETYHYRLKLFVEWCDQQRVEHLSDLSGWDLESYETYRRGEDLAPTTLAGEMKTLKNFLEYCERVEIVPEGLPEKVEPPKVDDDDVSSDVRLATEAALPLLAHYRENAFGLRRHVLLEVAWTVGCRLGGLRALDLRDFHPDEQYLDFVHRPETGTPLKNKGDGERPVALLPGTVEAIETYRTGDRFDVRDEHGRQPLFASRVGRPTRGSFRDWMYLATLPCRHDTCPHGQAPARCEYTEFGHGSKCPSSRSPHQVRTGSISWQLDCGVPPEVVSDRVNASLDVIEQHYDKSTAREKMEQRRRPHLDRLELDP